MSYQTYLAARGYVRVPIERTVKAPGDLILHGLTRPVERIPDDTTVVALRRKGRGCNG